MSNFSVAGMSSTSSHHSPNPLGSWASSSSNAAPTFSDSLSQSRSHYQSGYLMVRLHHFYCGKYSCLMRHLTVCLPKQCKSTFILHQDKSTEAVQNAPQGSPRPDDVPTVQTKAKMNHILSGGSATEFGMDSMFQSTRNVPVPCTIGGINLPNLQATSNYRRGCTSYEVRQ